MEWVHICPRDSLVSVSVICIHSIADNVTPLFSGRLQPQSADCYQYQYDSGSEVNWGSKGIVAQIIRQLWLDRHLKCLILVDWLYSVFFSLTAEYKVSFQNNYFYSLSSERPQCDIPQIKVVNAARCLTRYRCTLMKHLLWPLEVATGSPKMSTEPGWR